MARKGPKDVFSFYNGKVVSMNYIPDPKKRFSFAGMRALDNAKEGYIIDGEKVYHVSHAFRLAKLVTGADRDRILEEVLRILGE